MVLARDADGFEVRGPVRAVRFDDGSAIEARTVLVATGVSYQILDAPGLVEFTGRGVYYGADASDASSVAGDDVYVVGAANSAGQAVLNLARHARRWCMLVRSDSLEKSMSMYLVERIRAAENVEVRLQTEVVGGAGDGHLESITLADRAAGTRRRWRRTGCSRSSGRRRARIGSATVAARRRGFVVTGPELLAGERLGPGGRSSAPRSGWRRACPGCSRPATCGSTR